MVTRASTGNKKNSSQGTAAKIRKKIPRIEVKRAESFRSDNPEGKRKLLNLWRSITHTPLFNYQMLWFLIIALAVIGLMMQFSASVILELSAGTNPYWGVARPLLI
ncbi:MAG: hypothetical protein E6165_02895, partial [Varibaculum cambriense]|nr:hypothetical protein [Varibaculum cambriense]